MTSQITMSELFDYGRSLVTIEEESEVPVDWIIKNFIDPITGKLMHLEDYQKRILEVALTMENDGSSKYNLVVWSQTKKSGKTTVAAAVGAWFACNVEAPNEICCVANDQEQSAGRIYAALLPTLEAMGWHGVRTAGPSCSGPNASVVKAITTRYEKEAGANNGLSLWSELWAYRGERLTRLWEEMTNPPTRKFAMRWVETYAGFKLENKLLRDLYLKIFVDDKEEQLRPGVVKVFDDLPVYEIPEEGILVFWDHEHRMPWQTEKYYRGQRATLRKSTYARLHGNKWVDSSEDFITEDMWNTSVELYRSLQMSAIPEHMQRFLDQASNAGYVNGDVNSFKDKIVKLFSAATARLTYALDASVNNDSTALVGSVAIRFGQENGKVEQTDPEEDERIDGIVLTSDVKIWNPSDFPDGQIDQEVIMSFVYKLFKSGLLRPPLYIDPYQLIKMSQDLRRKGMPVKLFGQQGSRIKSDTFLYTLYHQGKLANVNDAGLRRHILSTSAKSYDGGKYRIIKPTISRSDDQGHISSVQMVDAAVAQSMSAYMAYHRAAGGWAMSGI